MEPSRAWVRRAALRFVRFGAMVVTSGLALMIGVGAAPADPLSAPAKPRHGASTSPPSVTRHPPGTPIIPPAPLGPPPLARAPLPLDTELLPVTASPKGSGVDNAAPTGRPAGS